VSGKHQEDREILRELEHQRRLIELLLVHQERQFRLLLRLFEAERHEQKFYLASIGGTIEVSP
jgi:hypothetical protein